VTDPDLQRGSVVIDLHVHGPGFVPQPFGSMWKFLPPTRPREAGFDILGAAGVDAVVAKAVGDPIVTRWYVRRSRWDAVEQQLSLIERQAAEADARVVTSTDELLGARADGQPAILLGVEGGDALGRDTDNVDRWHARGVRVVVLVHLTDNDLGTTCLPWQRYLGPLPVRRQQARGLSALGKQMVDRMQQVGVLVDLAHADRRTVLDTVDAASAPLVSSHSGARAVQDFPRYLTDDELRAIAGTGGVVGLWPYRGRRQGVATVDDLVAHARHIATVAGVDHLAIGTDMNGVPGQMRGYRDDRDLPMVRDALASAGFTSHEVTAILGGNALRVLRAVEVASFRS
jgi:membrane dipeptidase